MAKMSVAQATEPGDRRRRLLRISSVSFIKMHDAELKVENEYNIREQIGAGGFGEVYTCQHKLTRSIRALKKVAKSPDSSENESVINEFNIIKGLDHPNALKVYELFQDEEWFYIVTDIYKGGSLFNRIMDDGVFRVADMAVLMITILSCINYCHKNKIVHRDLTLENVLLDSIGKLDDLKIIDFGISRICSSNAGSEDSEFIEGTPEYMAPETLSGVVGPKTDIWACGIIAFVALGGYFPYNGTTEEIFEQVEAGEITFEYDVWDGVTDEAKDFIKYLLNPDVRTRPNAQEALAHPFLQAQRRRCSANFTRTMSGLAQTSLRNMMSFNAQSKLKQAACGVIASQLLTKEEKSQVDRLFRELDLDCDGHLDAHEIRKAYKEFGLSMSEKEIDDVIDRVDVDGTGTIEYWEFLVATISEKSVFDDDRLEAAFQLFDEDGNGSITYEEMSNVLATSKSMSNEIFRKILEESDVDGDGEISFEEFKKMMS